MSLGDKIACKKFAQITHTQQCTRFLKPSQPNIKVSAWPRRNLANCCSTSISALNGQIVLGMEIMN